MKKTLYIILFLALIVFIPSVKADEYDTCFDKYKIGTVSLEYKSTYWNDILPVLPVNEENTTYYVRFFPNENFTGYNNVYFSSSLTAVHTNGTTSWYYPDGNKVDFDVDNQIISFKTKSNMNDIIGLKVSVYTYNSNYTVLEDSPIIMSTNIEDVTTCEDIPEPSDNSFLGFYSLYLNKLGMIADYSLTNQYMFYFIGVILTFILLEIFLLLLRGGYRK